MVTRESNYIKKTVEIISTRTSAPLVKVNSAYMKHKVASTLLHRLVLSIELGTVQTGNGKADPAQKFKCTTAARVKLKYIFNLYLKNDDGGILYNVKVMHLV